jgi:hypothetical protein
MTIFFSSMEFFGHIHGYAIFFSNTSSLKSHAHGPFYLGIAAEPRHGAAASEQPGSQEGSYRPQGGGGKQKTPL